MAFSSALIDANLNGDSAGDRTIINPAGNPTLGSGVTSLKNSAGAIVGYLAANPNAMYITAAQGARTTSGRNTIEMPGINNWDISLAKKFNRSHCGMRATKFVGAGSVVKSAIG